MTAFDPIADLGLTKQQVKNLRKLAAHLRTLPVDYPDFGMTSFVRGHQDGGKAFKAECGTAACAAGHGPRAGIRPRAGERWFDYSWRAFAEDSAWYWCFSSAWAGVDNSAHGAADRIEYMLSHGVPANYRDQMYGDVSPSYRTESAA